MTTLSEYVNEQFVGQDKSKSQILEEIYKAAKDGWNDKINYVPLKPMALITVHDPGSSIIESIGFSEPDDIITNIFGAWFSGNFGSALTARNLSNTNGIVRTVHIKQANGATFTRTQPSSPAREGGGYMWVGRNGASSAVSRTDFQLNDPFAAVPEANVFASAGGGWLEDNQQVVANGLLASVTTSDVVGECGLLCRWHQVSTFTSEWFLLSHDIAGASFSSGQNINVTYTWSIT